jgi:hypothetical protein
MKGAPLGLKAVQALKAMKAAMKAKKTAATSVQGICVGTAAMMKAAAMKAKR